MSIHPNEIKLDRFPIFEEMTSFVSSARFWKVCGIYITADLQKLVRVMYPYCDVKVHGGQLSSMSLKTTMKCLLVEWGTLIIN